MDRTKYNYSSELEVELVKKNAVLCILVLFILTGCTTSEIEYETSRDEVIYSPSGNYSITLRYDIFLSCSLSRVFMVRSME
jgi:hypothetical protein